MPFLSDFSCPADGCWVGDDFAGSGEAPAFTGVVGGGVDLLATSNRDGLAGGEEARAAVLSFMDFLGLRFD